MSDLSAIPPTDHVVELVEATDRFNRFTPTCSCGWVSSKTEAICRATAAGERHVRGKQRRKTAATQS